VNKKKIRKLNGIKEIQKCYLCNNKAQLKCKKCNSPICNDCISNKIYCYKCDILEVKK
jgi:hypothetical protein